MNLMKRTEWFIPETLKKYPDNCYRAQQLIVFCFISPLLFIPNIIKWFRMGSIELGISMFVVMLLVMLYPLLIKYVSSFGFAGNWLIGWLAWHFSYLPYLTGGFNSTSLPWLLVIPVVGMSFIGFRTATFWMVFSLLEVSIFYYLAVKGIELKNIIQTPADANSTAFSNFIGPLLVIFFSMFFVNRGRQVLYENQQQAMQDQEKTLQDLQEVTKGVNTTIETIRDASLNLNSTSDHLMTKAAEMNEKSNHATLSTKNTATGIKQVDLDINQVSSDVTRMAAVTADNTKGKKEMGRATQEVTDAIKTISGSFSEIDNVLGEIAKQTQSSRKVAENATLKADQASKIVIDLGQSAKEIGEVMDLIKGIASQTNLLALNANIEAAGAGEAGKGFAVVANEVKELSAQTARASENIVKKVVEMQSNTEKAIRSISDIVNVIADINQMMSESTASINEQTSNTAQISNLMKETANSANLMLANTEETIALDLQTSQDIERVSGAAANIAISAASASQETESALQNINDVSKVAETTAESAASVKTQSGELEKLVAELSGIMQQIKL